MANSNEVLPRCRGTDGGKGRRKGVPAVDARGGPACCDGNPLRREDLLGGVRTSLTLVRLGSWSMISRIMFLCVCVRKRGAQESLQT